MKNNSTLNTDEHKNMVARLIQARIDSGLTQKQAADKLKKSQSFISKIEGGQKHIDVVIFYKMTKIYNWDLADYFELLG